MRKRGVINFLLDIGIDEDDIRDDEEWIRAKCPLAPWTHESGEDKRPSFGVTVSDEGRSIYYCFGCTTEAQPLARLLHNIYILSGRYPWEAAAVYSLEENHSVRQITPSDKYDDWTKPKKKDVPMDKRVVRQYPLLQEGQDYEGRRCISFLELERGVSRWAAFSARVRYNADNSSLIFPLTDVNGIVYILRERLRKTKRMWTVSPEIAGPDFKDMKFPSLTRSGVWFNMFAVDWSKPVMLVEAEMEALRLVTLGFPNVVASSTSNVTTAQLQALAGSSYISGYDDDVSGRKASERVFESLKDSARIYCIDWSDVSCSDPGELESRDQLREALDLMKVLN